MNRKAKALSILHRILHDQSAQVLPMMLLLLSGFFITVGFVVDIGDAYFSYNELQNATQAAALAGAAAITNTALPDPVTTAKQYGSETGNYNSYPSLENVATQPTLSCNAFVESLGISCVTYSGGGSATANAIQVVQTARVRMYFAALWGHPYLPLTATASAARSGAAATPYNIAIIIDTTASMSTKDTGSSCNSTRLVCALDGVQTLLQNLSPCSPTESSCGSATNGAVSKSVDRVALFTFPNIYTATTSDDYTCPTSNPTIQPYSFPSSTATTYSSTVTPTGLNATYAVTYGLGDADDNGFVSDYKGDDSTQTLSTASDVVIALGGKSGCNGVGDPGGAGTYYAGAIYAALIAEQAANPGSSNAIIIVSDGDATSSGTNTYACSSSTSGCGTASQKCTGSGSHKTCTTTYGPPWTMTANEMGSASTTSGLYPSTVDECMQAVTAAAYAANPANNPNTNGGGTKVYSVAYGAESSGCTTDKNSAKLPDVYTTPCATMKGIASSPNFFYSDYAQSGGGTDTSCVGSASPTTNLDQIFTDISSDFTVSRLIPNSEF